jgi:hypothetical protein
MWRRRVFSSSNPDSALKRRDYLILLVMALLVPLVVAALQRVPGYMDAAYYYADGTQLASGQGFQEPFIWNYLDHPQGLPHPSNAYWYPMASLVAASGMALTGTINFISARIGFILMAALAPLVTMGLAFRITRRRSLALLSGVLAVFSGYYLSFIATTDNYSLYLLVGAVYFLVLDRLTLPKSVLLGFLAGVLNLARGDGLLWLPLTLLAVSVITYRQSSASPIYTRIFRSIGFGFLSLAGYLLVMGAWMVRNLSVFGSVLPPGSGYTLWMTNYNQIYSFTPEIFTFQSWMAQGWQVVLKVRAEALLQNMSTAFFAQGLLVLFPLMVIGIYHYRRMFRVQVGVLAWFLLLFFESLLFPFASVNGGFFHAGTAFQPLWFALAPVGLEILLVGFSKNKNLLPQKATLFQFSLAVVVIVFSAMLVKIRVIDTGWNEGEYLYQNVDKFLVDQGAHPGEIVMTRNPPAYFIMTGRQAVVVPYGNVQTLLDAARKYNVEYVVLERRGAIDDLANLFAHPEQYPAFDYLGLLDETIILHVNSTR